MTDRTTRTLLAILGSVTVAGVAVLLILDLWLDLAGVEIPQALFIGTAAWYAVDEIMGLAKEGDE